MALNQLSADVEVWIAGIERADAVLFEVTAYTGNRPESAVFELLSLGNIDTVSQFESNSVEFLNASVNVKVGSEWVHFGRIAAVDFERGSAGERILYTSRFDDHMFGVPIWKAPLASDADLSSILTVNGAEIVLNPLYEGVIVDNRVRAADSAPFSHPTLLCPEEAYQLGITPSVSPWSLSYAVWFLCEWLNPFEDYVLNPTFSELEAVFPFDESIIRNVAFKHGAYLPEVLDALLNPLGYGWRVDHTSKTVRKIVVFARGNSNFVVINNDVSGTGYTSDDEALDIRVKNDIVSNSVTDVLVIGGRQQVETTIELTPDWDETLGGRDPSYYQMGSDLWTAEPGLAQVYRRWAAVPSDPYKPWRSGLGTNQWQDVIGSPDPFFTRRQFQPCITKGEDNRPFGRFGGCHIEYKVGSGDWFPVEGNLTTPALKEGTSIEILDDELGCYFNGDLPPLRQQQEGIENFLLRITGTIISTARAIINRNYPTSEIADFKAIVLDMESAFPFRKLYESVLAGRDDAIYDGIVDSTTLMTSFADSVLDRQKYPETSGTITMPTLDGFSRTHLGSVLQEIDGLEFSFWNGHAYPVISGWSVNIENQTTTIMLGGQS